MRTISAHADYQHKDYFFERTQSPAMRALEWEKSEAPLKSWSQIVYPALATAGALAAIAELIH